MVSDLARARDKFWELIACALVRSIDLSLESGKQKK